MTRRRVTATVALAFLVVLATATGASAHALRTASVPDAGAVLKRGPSEVTITFGEQPDPALSSITVLDGAGGHHEVGSHPSAKAGQPVVLTTTVRNMRDGVYTVSWRTVSKVDGHLATGSYSFGVNVVPKAGTTNASVSAPSPSVLALAARWLYDAGIIVLIGGGFVALLASLLGAPDDDPSDERRRAWWRWNVLVGAAWVAAFVGAVLITEESRSAAGLGWGDLFGHSLGHQLVQRAGPLVLAGLAVLAAAVVRATRPRRIAIVVLLVTLALAVAGEVQTSHGAATALHRWFALLVLSVHLSAAGLWVGGLAAVLVMIGPLDVDNRLTLAQRYSTSAGVVLVLVALTGSQRAYAEVGSWSALFHTTFGRWVLLKIVLFCVLAILGAINRFANVPATRASVRGLLRVGAVELVVAVVVIVATGYLQNLAPSAQATAASAPKPLVVNSADAGTTVRVRLEVAPGYPGFNEFRATVVDYDTKKAIAATRVSLTFLLPARADVARSRLDLQRAGTGTWRGNGANLSLPGRWSLTMLVQEPTTSVEVPFTVTTKATPQTITRSVSPGQPTIYTVHVVGDRSIQVYTDSLRKGLYEVHVTYFDGSGNELAVDKVHVRANRTGSKDVRGLPTRKLDKLGHFVSDIVSNGGKYHIDSDATTRDGAVISGHVDLPLEGTPRT